MDQWYREDGADGFNIMASEYPCDFTDFVNLVMPELQRRSVGRLVSRPDLAREHGPAPARASGAHVFRRREYEVNQEK